MTQKRVQESYNVSVSVSRSTYMKIKRLIDEGVFLNFSDFMRQAIEDELAMVGETGLKVNQALVREAKGKIIEFLKKRKPPADLSKIRLGPVDLGETEPTKIIDKYGEEVVYEALRQLFAERKVTW